MIPYYGNAQSVSMPIESMVVAWALVQLRTKAHAFERNGRPVRVAAPYETEHARFADVSKARDALEGSSGRYSTAGVLAPRAGAKIPEAFYTAAQAASAAASIEPEAPELEAWALDDVQDIASLAACGLDY